MSKDGPKWPALDGRMRAPVCSRRRSGLMVGAIALALMACAPGAQAADSFGLPPFGISEATTPQFDGAVPAQQMTLIGATPAEPGAPGADETWGVGRLGANQPYGLVRYYRFRNAAEAGGSGDAGTWTLGPALPSGFVPLSSPLMGAMTPGGNGVLAGTIGAKQVLLSRESGGPFQLTAPIPTEGEGAEGPLLHENEALFGAGRAPMIAALREAAGSTGALVVPVSTAGSEVLEDQVLHWDGAHWSSEPIEVPAANARGFRVLAIATAEAAHPQSEAPSAWLLAQLAASGSYPKGAMALFRRSSSEGKWIWKPVGTAGRQSDGEVHPLTVPLTKAGRQLTETEWPQLTEANLAESPQITGQILTADSEGVWVDGQRPAAGAPASTSLFVRAVGQSGAEIAASWCPVAAEEQCSFVLPEALVPASQPSRSFAWTRAGTPYGARVITGLPEGISLRLEEAPGAAQGHFERVLSLGAGALAGEDPGATYGAAFAGPTEGWLGAVMLPINLTSEPVPSRLSPWPSPFQNPLLAIAAQPGVPVASYASEAVAVGTAGQVARYRPQVETTKSGAQVVRPGSWQPESLFGPGQRVERGVALRAVAWPTPERIYAVGNEGQMWLWRGEIGLWESDPAKPKNFRGNLLGIAFDPEAPAIGYAVGSDAVGEGGVLLRYGKTWTEVTELPAQVKGAVFTSVAFAGNEALVTYEKLEPNDCTAGEFCNRYIGGLLVNDGSGWQVEEAASQALAGALPIRVAALPDGGAALLASSVGSRVLLEREGPASPWQPTPQAPPDDDTALTLFREGGAGGPLRALLAPGGSAGTLTRPTPAPPGFPPDFYEPIGIGENSIQLQETLLRQTASGWSDQTHELDPTGQPSGSYGPYYDLPYRPDPIESVLISEDGTQGWAVGGFLTGGSQGGQTSAIERYPADGIAPTGVAQAGVQLAPSDVTLAFGGHAECANPCAARARAGNQPQATLAGALALAKRIGVRSFFYTGPSISLAHIESPQRTLEVPYEQELQRMAAILAGGQNVHVAMTPQDRTGRPAAEGSEALFDSEMKPFLGGEAANCAHEECSAAYSLQEGGAHPTEQVAVIVLDDGIEGESASPDAVTEGEIGEEQLAWLQGQLQRARERHIPAVVVGSANLGRQVEHHRLRAERLAEALEAGEASAYFYDSPEEDERGHLADAPNVPTFGSGTLGYELASNETGGGFHAASGILLAQVEVSAPRSGNRAPVSARLIPVIEELAVEAKGGVLLRQSQPVLFSGLARRPRAGNLANTGHPEPIAGRFVQIPEECISSACANGLRPEYSFTSSNPTVGQFVEHNRATANEPLSVLQSAGHPISAEPVPGQVPPEEESAIFCPYNEGQTVVTLTAGGLSASVLVTVQHGAVRQPCDTVPSGKTLAAKEGSAPVPPPAPAPAPAGPAPSPAPVPVPPPPPLAAPPAPIAHPSPLKPVAFVPTPTYGLPPLAFVPPPLPTPARPTPPSGTSPVTSPIEVVEREEEPESATEQAANNAAAFMPEETGLPPAAVPLAVLLAALAGSVPVARMRSRRRGARVAYQTVASTRRRRDLEFSAQRRRRH